MSEIIVRRTVAASPAAVWSHIGDPGRIYAWHPGIAEASLEGDARVCVLAENGAVIRERILARDGQSYRYAITESPLPIRDYVSELRVDPEGDGASITWSSRFEALAEREAMEAVIRGVYEAGLSAVKTHFEE